MFRVELPRRQTARAEMRPTAVDSTVAGRLGNIDEMRERPVISSASAHSERVLIVEDNEDILESLSEILRMRGYTVARAFNGQEALEHLFHAKPPAVILLDLMMPVMDGEQFLDVKARIPGLAAIPVVLISAAGDLPGKAAELGVSDYLAKPIDAKRLLAIVERHCQRAPV
jgi:CheY-like chemotaxis protein